jgi:predicted enzyme related to lactoylglutathione lyase
MLLGLQIAVCHGDNLDQERAWYNEVLGHGAYFDDLGAYELGFHPSSPRVPKTGSAFTYWGVKDLRAEFERLQELGATKNTDIQEVGGGVVVATVIDPWGNVIGMVENPHFRLQEDA